MQGRVGPDSCTYLRHKKIHISACRGRYNLGQCTFACNSHTECRTFKKLVSPDSLNGAESLCNWPCPLPPRKIFGKTGKPTFSSSSIRFCPICVKLGMYTLQLDLILSYQKNFARSKNLVAMRLGRDEPNLTNFGQ